jgi:hypothetical protein
MEDPAGRSDHDDGTRVHTLGDAVTHRSIDLTNGRRGLLDGKQYAEKGRRWHRVRNLRVCGTVAAAYLYTRTVARGDAVWPDASSCHLARRAL